MRRLIPLALLLIASINAAAQAPAAQPVTVEYYYRVQWGYGDEFLRLFKKNHLPLLQAQVKSGRIVSVSAVQPVYHATEDGRWDYRVTIVFRDVQAAASSAEEEALIKRLYPDQETFKKEEQRRFEILEAHWDVPIRPLDLTKP